MALVKCPECGKEMSEFAESCLNCGSPIFDYFDKQKKLDKLNREFEEKIREVESEEIPDKPPHITKCRRNFIHNPAVNIVYCFYSN